jgi:hypothetical protein
MTDKIGKETPFNHFQIKDRDAIKIYYLNNELKVIMIYFTIVNEKLDNLAVSALSVRSRKLSNFRKGRSSDGLQNIIISSRVVSGTKLRIHLSYFHGCHKRQLKN